MRFISMVFNGLRYLLTKILIALLYVVGHGSVKVVEVSAKGALKVGSLTITRIGG